MLRAAGTGDGYDADCGFAAIRAGERSTPRTGQHAIPAAAVGTHAWGINSFDTLAEAPSDETIRTELDCCSREHAERDTYAGAQKRVADREGGDDAADQSGEGDDRTSTTTDRHASRSQPTGFRRQAAIPADEVLYFDELASPGRGMKRQTELVEHEFREWVQHDRTAFTGTAAAVFLCIRNEYGKPAGRQLRRFVSAVGTGSPKGRRHDGPSAGVESRPLFE